MHYIIVDPIQGMTAAERAYAWSRELYNITAPEATQFDYQFDGHVFGTVTHNDGRVALSVTLDYVIPINPNFDLTKLFALFPDTPQEEKDTIQQLLSSGVTEVTFVETTFSDTVFLTRDEMELDGWFQLQLIEQ